MRISFIKAAGFRGIKNELNVSFPEGFVVICGRNGSGKSSICDAIEYAICGHLQKSETSTERGESISDYLWWTGKEQPSARFVSIGFVTDDGRKLSITRSPDGVSGTDQSALLGELCDERIGPQEILRQLCRSSLFRDDDITRLSVDMTESERFTFVKEALGGADFGRVEKKAKIVYDLVKARVAVHQADYASERERVVLLKTQISQAATQISSQDDIRVAEETVRRMLNSPIELPSLILLARTEAAKLRVQIDELGELATRLGSLEKRLAEFQSSARSDRESALRESVDVLRNNIQQNDKRLRDLTEKLVPRQEQAPIYASLAQFYEHGTRVGLLDGHCPLCGSQVSDVSFSDHLREIKELVDAQVRELAELVTGQANLREQIRVLRVQLVRAEEELRSLSGEIDIFKNGIADIVTKSGQLGVMVEEDETLTRSLLLGAIDERTQRLTKLAAALALLETSGSIERMAEMQRNLQVAQKNVLEISERLAKSTLAAEKAKEMNDVIRRVSGEIVDDRLAELAPLLGELFVRLRPHVDWNDIAYNLRGDVRRFLRLTVGQDLNPRFMFSSGQRRAVGLAFLIAVYLSRPWCRLKSLVLDDPVQHIDDYRALHLVEVLSAIRQLGHQVVCTVEDPALASLLCRRLRSSESSRGMLLNLSYTAGQGVGVEHLKEIHPLPDSVLLSA